MAGIFEIQTFFWQHRVSIVTGLKHDAWTPDSPRHSACLSVYRARRRLIYSRKHAASSALRGSLAIDARAATHCHIAFHHSLVLRAGTTALRLKTNTGGLVE